jgi:hypothetical protein
VPHADREPGRHPELLDQAIHWIGYALETEQLMTDIEDATGRVSSLVSAAKQYSQMDRAAHQWIDVHSGLDSTLVMLTHKIGNGVKVVKDYDRTLPQIPAHPAELNQVWTNLIDNAVQAMNGVRHADDQDVPGERPRGVASATPARACPRSIASGSSSRSSPPSRSARAPGWAWTSRTGSWSTATAATSR